MFRAAEWMRHRGSDYSPRRRQRASRKPISGARRPRPADRYLVRLSLTELPRGILRAFIRPFVAVLVVDAALGEQPPALRLHEIVFVVAEAVEHAGPLRIVVRVVEPVGAAPCPVAVDLDDDVGDVVAADGGTQPGGGGRLRHLRDRLSDCLAAFDLS